MTKTDFTDQSFKSGVVLDVMATTCLYYDNKLKNNYPNLTDFTPDLLTLTLSSLTLHCHPHPLQAANCCRNSRLVVDEDDLKCV